MSLLIRNEKLFSKLPEDALRHARNGMRPAEIDELRQELSKCIEGEVRFDRGSIALYATDSSNFREIPLGIVVPRSIDDVVETHRLCSRFGAPLLNRGGGTSLSGETVNFAVVID